MPADLDAALQPGETIVYRTRGRAFGPVTVYCASGLFGVFCLFAAMHGVAPEPGETLLSLVVTVFSACAAMGALSGLILLVAAYRQRRAPDDLIVTDQRLLFTKGGWTHRIETVPHDRVQRIGWSDCFFGLDLNIVCEDRIMVLPDRKDPDAVARAVADAAGVGVPRTLGRMAIAKPGVLGYALVAAMTYVAIWMGLEAIGLPTPGGPLSLDLWWLRTVILALSCLIGLKLGQLANDLITATSMRPFVSPAEMQAGLCAGKPNRWDIRLALRWAGLLYGQPMDYKPS